MLCFALVFSGCTAAKQNPDGTPAAETGAQSTASGAAEGMTIGLAIGGILGGIGYALTGQEAFLAAGLALGGIAGAGYGAYVAKKKQDYASREQWLDANIELAEKASKETAAYNTKLKADIAQLDAESKRLAVAYKSGSAKKSDMKKMQAAIEKKKKENNSYIAQMEKVVAEQEANAAQLLADKDEREAAIVEHEIAKTKLAIEEARAQANVMANIAVGSF